MTSISLERTDSIEDESVLYNHICSPLSELDMEMIQSVPAGGNWKDIPSDVVQKSARLRQIRRSGGRTTYYGRLKASLPSYTINTYFNRPGNGTFIHPAQDRLISMREAARLQSFPDRYRFLGSRSSRYRQIGNAVPPLLARAVATLFKPGLVIDLFSGAGGLSEGFAQAGHKVILATDCNSNMCKTYAYNHPLTDVVQANLYQRDQSDELLDEIEHVLSGRHLNILIGGPPCQGFSTAGNRNSLDSRNGLLYHMVEIAQTLMPDSVVIENVPGLKWIHKGQVLQSVVKMLEDSEYSVSVFNLRAEEYGVPQRRRRVFIIGVRSKSRLSKPIGYLSPIIRGKTRNHLKLRTKDLPSAVNVAEAISDLPPIMSGEGDDVMDYDLAWTQTDYQKIMRELLSFEKFIRKRTKQG